MNYRATGLPYRHNKSRLNRASSPISPTWAAVVNDGNCESSVYLSEPDVASFIGKKLLEQNVGDEGTVCKVIVQQMFEDLRFLDLVNCRKHALVVCMDPKKARSWTRAKTLLEILKKVMKALNSSKFSIHDNSAKISSICLHVHVYIQYIYIYI